MKISSIIFAALIGLCLVGGFFSPPAVAAGRARQAGVQVPKHVTLFIVLDRSGSMSGQKIALARQAGQAVIKRLRAQDHVCIIAFDSGPRLVFPLGMVGTGHGARAAMGRITADGGTTFLPALQVATRQLSTVSRRGRRHILFISDGQAPRTGVLQEIAGLKKQGVTLSTVALGAGADAAFLSQMARRGAGRIYRIAQPSRLRPVLLKELRLVGR